MNAIARHVRLISLMSFAWLVFQGALSPGALGQSERPRNAPAHAEVRLAPTVRAVVPWMWNSRSGRRLARVELIRDFSVSQPIRSARFSGISDFADARVQINGVEVTELAAFGKRCDVDVFARVVVGDNTMKVIAQERDGPAAVALELTLTLADGTTAHVRSGGAWHAKEQGRPVAAATTYGGVESALWGDPAGAIRISRFDDYTQWKQALGKAARTDPLMYVTLPGFVFQRLRVAGDSDGSWVSMAFDAEGRLIFAREDKGLLRLSGHGAQARMETVNETLEECRGLTFAGGALYAHANNSKALYRLRDTNNDDRFDQVTRLWETSGGVGHGRNDLVVGPDRKLYAILGDAVDLPRGPRDWTSPAREHRRGQMTREGFVVRGDLDGKNWEVLAAGLRNPYGIDINREGEMFTYDADAEYDMGAPWYRPTRVNHLLPGADFGWRGVTKSWPPYYPDQPDFAPTILNVGKGSPTAIKFGYRSHFPKKYQEALYILDWAYGRVLAIHMWPRGSSYFCQAETFVKGRPLNVTDVAFGPDGAMYLITGGRKTRSALYRVTATGSAPLTANENRETRQQANRREHGQRARRRRRDLERKLLSNRDDVVAEVWSDLGSADPHLRYLAQCVLERQSTASWARRCIQEKDTATAVTALLALARVGGDGWRPKVLRRVAELLASGCTTRERNRAYRVLELCLLNAPDDNSVSGGELAAVRRRLESLYPAQDDVANQSLSKLLMRLGSTTAVSETMSLLDSTEGTAERMHFQFVLRDAKLGWTKTLRGRYFRSLAQMDRYRGGAGMPTFVQRIRDDALASLPDSEKKTYAKMLVRDDVEDQRLIADAGQRPLVKRWQMDELEPRLAAMESARSYQQGKRLFTVALCVVCHRMGDAGGSEGPDLSSVARRFSRRDLLVSILEPSRVVAQPYRAISVVMHDGKVVTGRPRDGGDYRAATLELVTDALHRGKVVSLDKSAIESYRESTTSPMPSGLLDTLTVEQILDLLAYLESGGDPRHRLYQVTPDEDG